MPPTPRQIEIASILFAASLIFNLIIDAYHQTCVRAKICARKGRNKYSNQAKLAGDFMSQRWRGYGFYDRHLPAFVGYWK